MMLGPFQWGKQQKEWARLKFTAKYTLYKLIIFKNISIMI